MYSSGNIDVRNWVHLFEPRCISGIPPWREGSENVHYFIDGMSWKSRYSWIFMYLLLTFYYIHFMGTSDQCGQPHIWRRTWCVATSLVTFSVAFIVLLLVIWCWMYCFNAYFCFIILCLFLIYPKRLSPVGVQSDCVEDKLTKQITYLLKGNKLLDFAIAPCGQLFPLIFILLPSSQCSYIILWSHFLLRRPG